MSKLGSCSIEGCSNKELSRTWCSKHYSRWSRNGDPEVKTRTVNYRYERQMSRDDGFWEQVDKLRRERIMGV